MYTGLFCVYVGLFCTCVGYFGVYMGFCCIYGFYCIYGFLLYIWFLLHIWVSVVYMGFCCIYGFLLYLFRVLCAGRGLVFIYTRSFCVDVRLFCMNTALLLCICGSIFFGECIDVF